MDVRVINVEEESDHHATDDGDTERSDGEINNAESFGFNVEEGSSSETRNLHPRKHFSSVGRTMPESYQGVGLVPSGVMYGSTDGNHVSNQNTCAVLNIHASTAADPSLPVKNATSMNFTARPPSQNRTLGKDAHHLLEYFKKMQGENPETIEEFESSWNSILDKYELRRNDWLRSLYNARDQWVPAYFHDSFFAAISPNQGFGGSFFEGYINQQMTLPLFFTQYERALESWIEKEIEADFETICTTPVLKTPSPMEKQAANLYTRKVFLKFQDELVETFVYTANIIEGDDVNSTFKVAKFEDVHKAYTVAFNHAELRANCSCQMFEYSGILCRHILTVFTMTNVLTLPSHYILKRWTKNAKSSAGSDELHGQESLTSRYSNLCREAIRYAEEGAVTVETYNVAVTGLKEGGKKVTAMKRNVAKAKPPNSQASGTNNNKKTTTSSTSDLTPLLWPRQDEITGRFNLNDSGGPVQSGADPNLPRMTPVSLHRDGGPSGNAVLLPCLKAMTWVMENKNSSLGKKVAVINLKLQDNSRNPSTEVEVKFQLSRVTLEPMLTSMASISEQLSRPANKVAVINLNLQDMDTNYGESEVKFQVSKDTLGAMLRSMAYIREQLSHVGDAHSEPLSKKHKK
ncbi:protein FAR1-RELATED SEQUENCE [Trifolium repens]|nr:protein FAR1-RELATED SEQUENCE [Trifolium repens]